MLELGNSSPPLTTASTASAEASAVSSSGNHIADELPSQPPAKKKRNQPGMPDPDAEVIALSPKALLATNRFLCEICGKGFQRDQNLQLHRRGHNLPWKLRQRGTKEVRKRVYVCPETSCVHHDPKRALGDLTGIKKHFCRKHGEKKWKCERCSKKYAVQSDWKAHMKTCGTKEYRCDCGTVFSRRDSFVTHRAFCDALAQETVKVQVQVTGDDRFAGASAGGEQMNGGNSFSESAGSPPVAALATPSVRSPVLSIQSSDAPETSNTLTPPTITASTDGAATHGGAPASPSAGVNGNAVFGSIFAPLSGLQPPPPQQQQQTQPPQTTTQFSTFVATMSSSSDLQPERGFSLASSIEPPPSLSLSSLYQFSQNAHPLFHQATTDLHAGGDNHQQFPQPPPPQPAMSATALLQKATQMGATTSPSSLLWGFGLSSSGQHDGGGGNQGVVKSEIGGGGGLGNYMSTGSLINGRGGLFSAQPTTLDLLGLGIGPSNGSPNGLSGLLTPFSGELDMGSFGGRKSWEGPPERKPNHSVP
ncbi:hypothetical protein V2J09_011712 [Rumex salicifolius]